jgi:hypothetical protein
MTERKLQVAFIKAVNKMLPQYPALALLYHIPNGELRDPKTAIFLKRMGVMKGVPDLHLPVARQGFHGLWMELKVPNGITMPYQKAVHSMLQREGHRVEMVRGVEEGVAILEDYLKERKGCQV